MTEPTTITQGDGSAPPAAATLTGIGDRPSPDAARAAIETHHIDVIPLSDRHGKPRDQFTLWFSGNITVINVVLGGLAIAFGLNLFWALIAIFIGNVLGSLLTAFHGWQGPRLGVPQMIQSRGQFGFFGADFIFLASILLDVGYMAASQALQGTSLHLLVPGVSVPWWIIIVTVVAAVVAIFGYRWIHSMAKIITAIFAVIIVVALIQAALYSHGIAAPYRGFGLSSFPVFVTVVSLLFMNMLSWAPYVSDYSRYLPPDSSFRRTFWAIVGGLVISSTLYSGLGAWITAMVPKAVTTPLHAIAAVSGLWIMFFMGLGQVPGVTFNAYSGMLATASLGSNIQKVMEGRARQWVRVVGLLVLFAIGTILAEIGWRTFLHTFEEFLTVLLFFFVPWSAINLVDFYLVRRGHYDVRSFFVRHGAYKDIIWPACIVYLITLGAQVPFLNTTLYEGPLAKSMSGAAISWIVGFFVAAGLYYLVMRVVRRSATQAPAPAVQSA